MIDSKLIDQVGDSHGRLDVCVLRVPDRSGGDDIALIGLRAVRKDGSQNASCRLGPVATGRLIGSLLRAYRAAFGVEYSTTRDFLYPATDAPAAPVASTRGDFHPSSTGTGRSISSTAPDFQASSVDDSSSPRRTPVKITGRGPARPTRPRHQADDAARRPGVPSGNKRVAP